MSDSPGALYDFVFRGQLSEQALDRAGRRIMRFNDQREAELAKTLSIDLLDDEFVASARSMAAVYVAIAAFESSARNLVVSVLVEAIGANWWEKNVSEKIRGRADTRRKEEEKIRWHAQRGADPITYTQLGDLVSIMRQNEALFIPYVRSIEWVANLFDVLERSRNVIMHSGVLAEPDVERIGIYLRDWIKQVGA